MARKRKRSVSGSGGAAAEAPEAEPAGPEEVVEGPAPREPTKKKKWKAAQLPLEMLKEFEAEGGMMIEEADDEDYGVAYGDGRAISVGGDAGEGVKQPKKKRKKSGEAAQAVLAKAADLESENARLRRELEAMTAKSEEAKAEQDLTHWMGYDLHPSLLRGLANLGFQRPTGVQARCLAPAIRQRKDVVAAAETGSGKTLAFGLPILHHMLSARDADASPDAASAEKLLSGLAILPTRELALQVKNHINAVAKGTPVFAECVVGGMSVLKQHRLLKRCPPFIVATPGRLFALLGLGKDPGEEKCEWLRGAVRGLRHLVLDEADRLVEAGHFKELDRILAHVYDSLERAQQLQTFVFSATLTLDPKRKQAKSKSGDAAEGPGGKVEQLMQRLRFREPRAVLHVDLTKDAETPSSSQANADETVMPTGSKRQLPDTLKFLEAVASDEKDREGLLAVWLLRRFRWEPAAAAGAPDSSHSAPGGRVVIFVNAITMVMRLTPILALLMESKSADKVLARVKMKQDGGREKLPGGEVDVFGLHSRLRQKDRLKMMDRFRACQNGILVCTDIAARGLDVKGLAAVVHLQAPRSADVFVHRSGRTARAGQSGESVAFVAPGDVMQWNNLYKAIGLSKSEVDNVNPTAFELTAAKEAVRLAADLEQKAHRISKDHNDRCWMQRAADEAEIILDDDERDKDKGKDAAPKKQLWGLYQQLVARVRRAPRRQGGGPLPRKKLGGVPLSKRSGR